jgi:hypothetical protein
MAVNPLGMNQGTNSFINFEDDGGTVNTQVVDIRRGSVVMTLGTVGVGTVDLLKAGTITKLEGGTLGLITRISNIGTLEVGTVIVSAVNSIGTLGTVQMINAGTISLGTVTGAIANNAADSGNPVKVGGVYNGTAPTLDSGDRGDLQLDVNGNLLISNNTPLAGEDLTNNVMKVEHQYSYYHHVGTAGSTSGTIKSAAGFLHNVNFNIHTTGGTYTLYDSAGTSGTVIANITGTSMPNRNPDDVIFLNGLTIVSGSVCDLTISYR